MSTSLFCSKIPMIRDLTLQYNPTIHIPNSSESRILTSDAAKFFLFVTDQILSQSWKDQLRSEPSAILAQCISKKILCTSRRIFSEKETHLGTMMTLKSGDHLARIARCPWRDPCCPRGFGLDRSGQYLRAEALQHLWQFTRTRIQIGLEEALVDPFSFSLQVSFQRYMCGRFTISEPLTYRILSSRDGELQEINRKQKHWLSEQSAPVSATSKTYIAQCMHQYPRSHYDAHYLINWRNRTSWVLWYHDKSTNMSSLDLCWCISLYCSGFVLLLSSSTCRIASDQSDAAHLSPTTR